MESLSEAFGRSPTAWLTPRNNPNLATAWKAIVKAYLSPEHCDHAECGCPLAALAPELARADKAMKAQILGGADEIQGLACFPLCRAGELPTKSALSLRSFQRWSGQLKSPGCCQIQRDRAAVLASTRDFLLDSFLTSSMMRSGEAIRYHLQRGIDTHRRTHRY